MSARGFAWTLLAWMSSPGLFLMGCASFLEGESPLKGRKNSVEIVNAGHGVCAGKIGSAVERARTRCRPSGFVS